MTEIDMEYPEDDSPDLTDEEIASAVATVSSDAIVSAVQSARCSTCQQGSMRLTSHELRRRKPHLYWRVGLVCAQGHNASMVFLTDWL